MCGYVLNRKEKSKITKIIFLVILSGMMFPYQMAVLGLYKLVRSLDLMNTLTAVIFIDIAINIPFATFLMKNSISSVPIELEEAARIDGVSEIGLFFKIYMPTIKSTYAAAAIITFMSSWNNYLWPLISLQTKEQRTLPLMISSLGTAYTPDFGMIMVGIIITTIPSAVIFFLMQKSFVDSMMGSVK